VLVSVRGPFRPCGALGCLDFLLAGTGIVGGLSALLAKAGISVFYLSTANTDFVLVSESKLEKAIASLRGNFNITMETDINPVDPAEQEALFARVRQA